MPCNDSPEDQLLLGGNILPFVSERPRPTSLQRRLRQQSPLTRFDLPSTHIDSPFSFPLELEPRTPNFVAASLGADDSSGPDSRDDDEREEEAVRPGPRVRDEEAGRGMGSPGRTRDIVAVRVGLEIQKTWICESYPREGPIAPN